MPNDILPPASNRPLPKTDTSPKQSLSESSSEAETPIKNLDTAITVSEADLKTSKPGRRHNISAQLKRRWQSLSRNKRFALISAALLIFGASSLAFYYFQRPEATPSIQISKKAPVAVPTTVPSPLSGLQVAPELAKRPATAIMIENSLESRPQSGLQEAGVVFEAIAEGGITRFMAIFQDTSPQFVGPVRSLRPYYIDWANAFDAGIAHVGGSPEALAQIRSGGKDLDQFFNAGSYWRQAGRQAPHNVYTSFEKLDALNKSKGFSSTYKSWARKADKALAVPTAKGIGLNISSANYHIRYDYDGPSNSYLRSVGGKPHIVTASAGDSAGAQLKPKVVIALVASYGLSGKYSVYVATGTGPAYIYQDGGVTIGTWTKAERTSQFEFKDAAGAILPLNAGQSWVTILADTGKISSTP